MYIIIAGSGIVGFHIASLLAEGKHEVTVIEPSEEIVDSIRRQMDVKTVLGKDQYAGLLPGKRTGSCDDGSQGT